MKVFFLLLISFNLYSQTDWGKWDKTETDYRFPEKVIYRNYSFDSENPAEFLLKSLVNAYWFFVSDVDGDNCPLRPSCSVFFFEAAGETNIFKAGLMFADRFTRDTNVFKRNKYPRTKHGYFYDPVNLYTLHSGKIQYIPPSEVVDFE
jgi:putative component of membrane protein insertase Oxa1/YidC/SpoIIIJ protein YidD